MEESRERVLSGKTGQPDPLSPVEPDHWKPGSIAPSFLTKTVKNFSYAKELKYKYILIEVFSLLISKFFIFPH